MLWKKESRRSDALYEDIFTKCQYSSQANKLFNQTQSKVDKSKLHKNNAIALTKQQEGDKYFKKKKWFLAAWSYDESLSYAENGSELISAAYAKRSKCFLKMDMYKECLKDIELSKEAGCPDKFMPQLERRAADCLAHLENGDGQSINHTAALDFDPDDKFPCMANVLKIEKSAAEKYSVVAQQDIEAGKIIIVEDTLKFIHVNIGRRCAICLKAGVNLIPCAQCSIAMFCSTECQQNFLHEYECGVMFSNDIQGNGSVLKNLRGIYKAINMFSSVDELMDFVEETIASGANELPEALTDERSKYRAFLKQRTGPEFDDDDLAIMMIPAFKLILKNAKVNAMFKATKHRRFLMHLIAQHTLISQHNSRVLICKSSTDEFNQYSCFGVMAAYLNHSCAPNAMITFDGVANCVYVLVRPVKKGEEVLISWVPFPLDMKTKQRKQLLWEQKGLRCDCLRCIGVDADCAHRQRISLDEEFISIMSDKFIGEKGAKEISERIEKCAALLNKFGEVDWCYEISDAIMAYIRAFTRQFE